MRAENLRHAATGVIVRDPLGRLYVHRRTHTKDVYPGRWDFTAGGVVLFDEDPDDGARREVLEELGVTGKLVPLGEADYTDEHTTYHAFRYVITCDGAVDPQPEEIAYGSWVTIERLMRLMEDPDVLFMPDTVALFGDWLRERAAERTEPTQGWDSVVTIIEGTWIEREPRFRDVAVPLRAETVLLPAIAPLLPLAVPLPEVMDEDPLRVRHVLLPGEPATDVELTADDGRKMGEFLRTLHDIPHEVYAGTGVADELTSRAELMATLDKLLHRVLPLLPEEHRERGGRLLRQVAQHTPITLVHGDLGPTHLLSQDGELTAVIDWTDARMGDPALDLAWVLYGAPEPFAEALATTYGVTDEELARALAWHRLGPWYEVLWGHGPGGPEYIESGLEGILARIGDPEVTDQDPAPAPAPAPSKDDQLGMTSLDS
jgi:aminoglycoside phosphotransferase (APT) family kinase protein/8-oxo-dGTP pyrophosphatase MutT (NUDIX family)